MIEYESLLGVVFVSDLRSVRHRRLIEHKVGGSGYGGHVVLHGRGAAGIDEHADVRVVFTPIGFDRPKLFTLLHLGGGVVADREGVAGGAVVGFDVGVLHADAAAVRGLVAGDFAVVEFDYNVGGMTRTGNCEYLAPTAKFDANLIKDETGTTIGVVFTQRAQ